MATHWAQMTRRAARLAKILLTTGMKCVSAWEGDATFFVAVGHADGAFVLMRETKRKYASAHRCCCGDCIHFCKT
eukprot:1899948-Prymnesium_polylepis.2